GQRQPLPAVGHHLDRGRALDRRGAAGRKVPLHRPVALPAAGPGLRDRSGRRRHPARAFRAAAARGDAGTIAGALRWRPLPRWRGDRRHRRAAGAAPPRHVSPEQHRMMHERILALAGLVQALKQVRRIADTGQADASALSTALDSVFRIDADSTESVYGTTGDLRPGLVLLRDYFGNRNKDEALPRLALAVMQIERRFVRDGKMARQVRDGIVATAPIAERLGSDHP